MAHYIVSYDLHNQRHYQPVWNKLESWGGATRLLESLWVVTTSLSAEAIRDSLHAAADNDDSFVAIELKPASDWATRNGKPLGVQWMKQNIG